MKSFKYVNFLLILDFISFTNCYNSSSLKHVTEDSLKNYSKENGSEGCYALYDTGANYTETCTQFILDFPYICCKVHYEIGDFKNDFCMPIANNTKALSDVTYSFRHADKIEISCISKIINFSFILLSLFFILII